MNDKRSFFANFVDKIWNPIARTHGHIHIMLMSSLIANQMPQCITIIYNDEILIIPLITRDFDHWFLKPLVKI